MSEQYIPPDDYPETQGYWAATRDKKLVVQKCSTSGKFQHPPRATSIHDLGGPVEWHEVSGKGTIHALTVHHRPGNRFMKGKTPYAVALIDLEEGVRIMSNVIECDPEKLKIGDAVTVAWDPLPDGRHLPQFKPA